MQKQTALLRIAYNPQVPPSVEGGGSTRFTDRRKGQTVTSIIGACAYTSFPLIMDLTDGVVHNVLELRGLQLYEWLDLTPQQVCVNESGSTDSASYCFTFRQW